MGGVGTSCCVIVRYISPDGRKRNVFLGRKVDGVGVSEWVVVVSCVGGGADDELDVSVEHFRGEEVFRSTIGSRKMARLLVFPSCSDQEPQFVVRGGRKGGWCKE